MMFQGKSKAKKKGLVNLANKKNKDFLLFRDIIDLCYLFGNSLLMIDLSNM